MAATKNLLQKWFVGTKSPVILSAPMLAVSNGTLAAEVTKAGGFGVIPAGYDVAPNSAHLTSLDAELTKARNSLGDGSGPGPLPVGIGFINFHSSTATHFRDTVGALVAKHRPAAVWLFAPDPAEPADLRAEIVQALKSVSSAVSAGAVAAAAVPYDIKVFVQVGTVAAARAAARDGVDAIVAQGVDAGGHQFAAGSGVVSLVPEVRDMLDAEFPEREIALLAAGGIGDGRGVAAALALGADGAVLGTRFIVAKEALSVDAYRKLIIDTKDGGATTVKSYAHDDVRNLVAWPKVYDGRAVINNTYRDFLAGMPLEENQKKLKEATANKDPSRGIYWSGTAVGLVKEELSAGEIVTQVREGARQRMKALQSAL